MRLSKIDEITKKIQKNIEEITAKKAEKKPVEMTKPKPMTNTGQ